MPLIRCLALLAWIATPAFADPLRDMAGEWQGSGWARQTAESEQEAVRCRLGNDYQAAFTRLRVRGTCVVPGRRFGIDGMLALADDGTVRGFWADPDGGGQTTIAGRVEGDAILFAFDVTRPASGERIAQSLTWRLMPQGLSFAATDRQSGTPMARIDFER